MRAMLTFVVRAIVYLIAGAIFIWLLFQIASAFVFKPKIKEMVCKSQVLFGSLMEQVPGAGWFGSFIHHFISVDCNIEVKASDWFEYMRRHHRMYEWILKEAKNADYLKFPEYQQFIKMVNEEKILECLEGRKTDNNCVFLMYLIYIADSMRRLNSMLASRPAFDCHFASIEAPPILKTYNITEGDITFALALIGYPHINKNYPADEKERWVSLNVLKDFIDTSQIPGTNMEEKTRYLSKLLQKIAEEASKKAKDSIDTCMPAKIELRKKIAIDISYWAGRFGRNVVTFFTDSLCGRGANGPAIIVQ